MKKAWHNPHKNHNSAWHTIITNTYLSALILGILLEGEEFRRDFPNSEKLRSFSRTPRGMTCMSLIHAVLDEASSEHGVNRSPPEK